jgi:hypothetical protein
MEEDKERIAELVSAIEGLHKMKDDAVSDTARRLQEVRAVPWCGVVILGLLGVLW